MLVQQVYRWIYRRDHQDFKGGGIFLFKTIPNKCFTIEFLGNATWKIRAWAYSPRTGREYSISHWLLAVWPITKGFFFKWFIALHCAVVLAVLGSLAISTLCWATHRCIELTSRRLAIKVGRQTRDTHREKEHQPKLHDTRPNTHKKAKHYTRPPTHAASSGVQSIWENPISLSDILFSTDTKPLKLCVCVDITRPTSCAVRILSTSLRWTFHCDALGYCFFC